MTAFNQVVNGSFSKRGNIKDGRPHRPPSQDSKFEGLGFVSVDWNKWRYTWPGKFPAFLVSPGTIATETGQLSGLIARHEASDTEIYFPYGTEPQIIKERLDNKILEIMRLQAGANELPLDWQPHDDEIDIDKFMADLWVSA